MQINNTEVRKLELIKECDYMNHKKRRIIAVLLIVVGVVLGVTWNNARFCVGDNLFVALGLPAWSNGTTGTHYPAVVGSVIILVGIGLLNSTLQPKARRLLWGIVILLLIVFNLLFSLS